jgi:hypothetical protein
MKTRLRGHLRTYSSHILVAVLTLAFFSSVYTALAVNYVTPGLTLDPGADFPVLCADPLNDCTTEILRIGNPIGGATSGSIPFVDASGNLAEDNSNLFWDETNNRLGIGTNTPASRLDISTSAISPAVVGAATEINGGLLDDLTSGGTYTGLNDNTIYVYVDSPGATDTFAWADLNGDFPGDFGIPITPGPITLTGTGVTVTFGATTGHDGGELWEIPVTASAVVTSGDFNFGGSLLKGGSLWAGAIGGVVDNATANSVPFIDASGNLAEDTLFTYDSSTTLLSVNAINIPNTTSSSQGVIQKNGSRFFHTYNTGVSNENLFIGVNAGNFTLTAPGAFKNANNGIGQNALSSLTTGFFNTAVGTSALRRMTTGSNNTAVGLQALNNAQIAVDSIAIGESALFGGSGIGTLTGGKNVAIGNAALYDTTSGANNTALGYHAGLSVNSGSNNIFIGLQAGDSLTTGSNNIALGYDIDLPSSTGSNQLSIGNLIFGSAIDGTGATISSGNIGIGDATPDFRLDVEQTTDGVVATFADNDNNCTIDPDVVGGISCTSDARRKENVVTIDDALTDIRKLRTVSYDFIGDGDSSSIGFIAQELKIFIRHLSCVIQTDISHFLMQV